MCGRYRLSRRKQILEEHYAATSDDADWSPRYNIAPTQFVPIVRQNPRSANRELSLIRWGLVPSWAKDSSKSAAMTNARSETAASKPAFCDALKFRRCLIPADGFYEWQIVAENYRLRVGESDGIVHVSAHLRMNILPTIKPGREQFGLVLKRSQVAHMGSRRGAHLWHTFKGAVSCCSGNLIGRVVQNSCLGVV